MLCCIVSSFFFFNDTATTEIYTLSLHDALPIFGRPDAEPLASETIGPIVALIESLVDGGHAYEAGGDVYFRDRKSTRLNSSHANISYAVFCLKKKKKTSANNTHNTKYRVYN